MDKQLVQISSGSWVNPDEVIRIYTCESFEEGKPARTYVVCRGFDSGVSGLFGSGATDHVILSDWSSERIASALGLVDADALDAQLRGEQ